MIKRLQKNMYEIAFQIRREGSYTSLTRPEIRNIEQFSAGLILLFAQLIVLVFLIAFTVYAPDADASDLHNTIHPVYGGFDQKFNRIVKYHNLFQDVHVMIFAGFGFLMTFLRKYGFSAVGFNFLLAAMMIQWAILCNGFFNLDENTKIPLSIESLLKADVASAAVLISMGALLGKTSYIQLLVMGVIEIAVFSSNMYLGSEFFKVSDAGGSIFVHVMGAYFGLGVSYVLCRNKKGSEVQNTLEGSSYTSDLFAMIGTIFLWMFWPSFNAGEVEGDDRHRAVINTYLALASCCVTAFAVSAIFTPGHKFDMVHIQNSTLAGGVAVGTAANMMVQPYGAVIIGIVAGALSVLGYAKLTPLINSKLNIHDTCGVHNLHGMPGVLAGLIGALMASIATEDTYHHGLYEIWPARAPTTAQHTPEVGSPIIGDGRSASVQAGYQLLAVVVTLLIAIIAGVITGFIILSPVVTRISPENRYDDALSWHLPDEEHAEPSPYAHDTELNGSKHESPSVLVIEEISH
ncbi:hypothetical protein PPYR_07340 [Photinus pyralis]|uniref:Ammonium transporter AmtB-like domain-containing protein n=1 Tax=Photinus pyralis TaxID=7054 RepID=A0A5N4AQ58_PHOPY|nr:ammonium transporter Rh type B isoform X2 [Photinus pyralis]KAB0799460.1 hypothetical protein PPYR_07340 [Photinus pyralis]